MNFLFIMYAQMYLNTWYKSIILVSTRRSRVLVRKHWFVRYSWWPLILQWIWFSPGWWVFCLGKRLASDFFGRNDLSSIVLVIVLWWDYDYGALGSVVSHLSSNWSRCILAQICIAQSAGVVEYTDYISLEGYDPTQQTLIQVIFILFWLCGWGSRMHRLNLFRRVRPPKRIHQTLNQVISLLF